LKNLSLEVKSGEVFGFLGPNGAGKSTTIKALMGLILPTSGDTHIWGIPSDASSARRNVGYLPENPAFYDFLTAREYLRFVGASFGMSDNEIRVGVDHVLSRLDLQVSADRPIRGYSKGMVQRLGLAQTLLHDPDLYILDEPMSGLDPIGRALVKEIILDLKAQGKTFFFSTHVTADVERVCDRIGVIANGVLQEERNVSELLREGIEGYFCRLRNVNKTDFGSFDVVGVFEGGLEVFVSKNKFNDLASKVLGCGGQFDLVEPRRKDVEDYFLGLVLKAGDS